MPDITFNTEEGQNASAVWPPAPTGTEYEPYQDPSIQDIRQFQPFNGWLLFLLLIVTLGLYQPFWMIRTAKVANRLVPDYQIPEAQIWTYLALLIFNIVGNYVAGYLSVSSPAIGKPLVSILQAGSYAISIYGIFLSFRFRGALNAILERTSPTLRRFGGLGTFFFSGLYLQIRLNQRIDERNKQLAGHS